jgi:uncharacterized protein (DUF1800 family)
MRPTASTTPAAPSSLPPSSSPEAAAIAAHRFGLGEADLGVVGGDAFGWLHAQIGPAPAQRGEGLHGARDAMKSHFDVVQQRRAIGQANAANAATASQAAAAASGAMAMAAPAVAATVVPVPDVDQPLRVLVQNDIRARVHTAAASTQPFAERLALFWANHFSVSVLKGAVRGTPALLSARPSGRTSPGALK